MRSDNFSNFLKSNHIHIKRRCLTILGSRDGFSSENISVEQILDLLIAASASHLKGSDSAGMFVELGTRLAHEGWPVRLVLEIIHTYPIAVWLELGSQKRTESDNEKQALALANLSVDEYCQLLEQINSWVEWLVDGFIAQKDEYITELYEEVTQQQASSDLQLQAARATAGAISHHLNQPLTALSLLADFADEGLDLDEIKLLQEAVAQANQIVRQLQNLQNYSTKPYLDNHEILDLSKATSDN